MRDLRYILMLLALTAFLFLFGLGNTALTDPDETFYAETAREMLDAGEWVTPLIFGEPQFEKPILYYWTVMAGFISLGVTEFAARFPSVLFGMAGILGIYFLGRSLFSPLCGFLSGVVLATCAQYVVLARACVTDMALAVFILLCLLFFLRGWVSGRTAPYMLSALMAALAVLTKGPIGLFIPGMVILLYVVFSGQWKTFFRIPFIPCALVFLAVCLPWYIAVTRIHGTAFINEFFGFQNVTRFLVPEHRIGSSPFFYVPAVIGGFLPWSVFLPAGIWDMYRNRGRGPESGMRGKGLFLLAWFLLVFVFFSVSRTKLVTYIFPLFPVMALVTGRFWERAVSEGALDRLSLKALRGSAYVLSACAVAGTAVIAFLLRHEFGDLRAVAGGVMAGIIFTAGTAFSGVFLLRGKVMKAFVSLALAAALIVVPVVIYVLPVVEKYESSRHLSVRVMELARLGDLLGGECDHRRGIAFYTGVTDIADVHPYHQLKEFVSRKQRVWCIIQRKHYDQLISEKGQVVSEPVDVSGEYVLVNNRPGEN